VVDYLWGAVAGNRERDEFRMLDRGCAVDWKVRLADDEIERIKMNIEWNSTKICDEKYS